jgi:hypothetical protein
LKDRGPLILFDFIIICFQRLQASFEFQGVGVYQLLKQKHFDTDPLPQVSEGSPICWRMEFSFCNRRETGIIITGTIIPW